MFLSDCFIVWKEVCDKILHFKSQLNNINHYFPYSTQYISEQIQIFDNLIIKNPTMMLLRTYLPQPNGHKTTSFQKIIAKAHFSSNNILAKKFYSFKRTNPNLM